MQQAVAIDLGNASAEEASRTLAAAFSADPTVRWICQDRRTGYDTRVRALYNALVDFQIACSHPRLGVWEGSRLAATCHLRPPGARVSARNRSALAIALARRVGLHALVRGARFEHAIASAHPRRPHYYLASIGVDPVFQGRGYGGVLLRAADEMVRRHPDCSGIALDTQNPRNVSLYERFGYRVTRKSTIGPLTSWWMFREMA